MIGTRRGLQIQRMPPDDVGVSLRPDKPRFFDAHNHLHDERFGGRQGDLLTAAFGHGVAAMVVNGSGESDWRAVQQLAHRDHRIIPAFGCHPWYLAGRTPGWQQTLVRLLDETPGAVVGETGLDRWKPGLPYEDQEAVFVWQLRLAAERDLAISIHCLKAWGRLLALLREHPRPARGLLLHSYGGSAEMVKPLVELGAYFSFPGYYLHARKERQRETFRHVPLNRLLVETDAPDQCLPDELNAHPLADTAGRALNHPGNLGVVYEHLALLRGLPLMDLAGCVESNFKALFSIEAG